MSILPTPSPHSDIVLLPTLTFVAGPPDVQLEACSVSYILLIGYALLLPSCASNDTSS